jgi:hypothetical protein
MYFFMVFFDTPEDLDNPSSEISLPVLYAIVVNSLFNSCTSLMP